jgi:hypothetical protein
MPIGVPKVRTVCGDDSSQWVDYIIVYTVNVFYFLCQDLDDELANQLIGIMLYLNSENSKKIFVFILIHRVVLLLAGWCL